MLHLSTSSSSSGSANSLLHKTFQVSFTWTLLVSIIGFLFFFLRLATSNKLQHRYGTNTTNSLRKKKGQPHAQRSLQNNRFRSTNGTFVNHNTHTQHKYFVNKTTKHAHQPIQKWTINGYAIKVIDISICLHWIIVNRGTSVILLSISFTLLYSLHLYSILFLSSVLLFCLPTNINKWIVKRRTEERVAR